MDRPHSDFRKVAEAVLRSAEQQGLKVRDWGDGICLDFSDGLDALGLGPSDLTALDETRPIDDPAKDFLRRFHHLDRRRARVLNALRRLWHEAGADLHLGRSGYGSVETGTFCSTISAGRQLTRQLETHTDLEALVWIRGSFLRRLSDQEMQALLERQDPPPPLAAEEGLDFQPIEEAEWAQDLARRYPHLETIFLPPDQLPAVDSEALRRASFQAHRALQDFQARCSSRAHFLARAIEPPWVWLTQGMLDPSWIRRAARGITESRKDDWWTWLAGAEILVTLDTDLEPYSPSPVPGGSSKSEITSVTDQRLRDELRQKIVAWWDGGGHDIQEHLDLLGLFPELRYLTEEVMEHEEQTPHARSLLRWHLPARRSMAVALEEATKELLASKSAQEATLYFDGLHQLCFAIGPQWCRKLIAEQDLEAIESLLLTLAQDLPAHLLSMELAELAKMAGLFRWHTVAEGLIDRPDLPSLLFSIPWQSLEIRSSDSLIADRFTYSETLLGLVNAAPGHPQLRRWIALALHLESQHPENPSLLISDAIPPNALLAMAWHLLNS